MVKGINLCITPKLRTSLYNYIKISAPRTLNTGNSLVPCIVIVIENYPKCDVMNLNRVFDCFVKYTPVGTVEALKRFGGVYGGYNRVCLYVCIKIICIIYLN